MADKLSVKNISLSYQTELIIDSLSISFPENQITTIIGPNGCGKSTLLKSISRIIQPHNGNILLNNKDISGFTTKEIAKKISYLPQEVTPPNDTTVREMVSIGRYPYLGLLQKFSQKDEKIVDQVLFETNLKHIENITVESLSGGQKQRAFIAMALAQKTPIILLDEPTTYLDIKHQVEILELLNRLNKEKGLTIIMVLHDINLASRFSNNIIGMKGGKILYNGSPEVIMNSEILESIFGVKAVIGRDPIDKKPICLRFG